MIGAEGPVCAPLPAEGPGDPAQSFTDDIRRLSCAI